MVAIKSYEADKFLAKQPEHILFFLVFGLDTGLISERARQIVRGTGVDLADPFQLIRLAGDDLAGDPLRLADEANTVPLFGGKRAIWVTAGGKSFMPALEPLFSAPPRDCAIIIEAGNLKKDHALRKALERDRNAAAIECYPDSPRDVEALIEAEVRACGLKIDKDARTALVALLGQDRLTTRSELSKLILYTHGRGTITLADVETTVADASAMALDDAINGAFQGNFAAIEETAERAFASGGDYNQLLGLALRHATQLHRARLEMDNGKSLEEAAFLIFRGMGGRDRKAALETQLKNWTSAKLTKGISVLSDAIGKSRREAKIANVLAVRALWTIALSAKSRTA